MSTTSSKPGKPTSTSKVPESPLAEMEPCDLLTESAAQALGITGKGSPEKLGRGRACLWTVPAESGRDRVNLGVAIFDTLGVADIVAKGEIKSIPNIGGHEAKQSTGVADNCVFSLAVSATSRVDIIGTAVSFDKACEVASAAAKLVEPTLP